MIRHTNSASEGSSAKHNLDPEAAARLADFLSEREGSLCETWMGYLRNSDSTRYLDVDTEDLRASLCGLQHAFVDYLRSADIAPLILAVHAVAHRRLEQGFPLVDLARAVGAMRMAALPVLVESFQNEPVLLMETMAILMTVEEISSVQIAVAYQEITSAQLRRAHNDAIQAEDEKLRFCRDMARVVTHGRLILCDHEDLPEHTGLPPTPVREPRDIRMARHAASAMAEAEGWEADRRYALQLCIGEAGTNSLKHGGTAVFQVWKGDDGSITFRLADTGPGIDFDRIPSALSSGFSTVQTLGMGFTVMLEMADLLHLATDHRGTTIQLTLHKEMIPVSGRRAF